VKKKRMKKEYQWEPGQVKRVVAVRWSDAYSRDEWHSLDRSKSDTPTICDSVGVLLADNKEGVKVACTTSPDLGLAGVMSIPRGMVLKLTELAELK